MKKLLEFLIAVALVATAVNTADAANVGCWRRDETIVCYQGDSTKTNFAVSPTQEEITAFRKQYEDWLHDYDIAGMAMMSMLGADTKRAAALILYSQKCDAVPAAEIHHAEVTLEAFGGLKQGAFSAANGELKMRGLQGFCRWMNPTPKP